MKRLKSDALPFALELPTKDIQNAMKIAGLSLVLNCGSLLIGSYSRVSASQEVRNGFPFPFLIQKVEIDPGRLLGIEIAYVNLVMNLLFWMFVSVLLDTSLRLIGRRTSLRRTFEKQGGETMKDKDETQR